MPNVWSPVHPASGGWEPRGCRCWEGKLTTRREQQVSESDPHLQCRSCSGAIRVISWWTTRGHQPLFSCCCWKLEKDYWNEREEKRPHYQAWGNTCASVFFCIAGGVRGHKVWTDAAIWRRHKGEKRETNNPAKTRRNLDGEIRHLVGYWAIWHGPHDPSHGRTGDRCGLGFCPLLPLPAVLILVGVHRALCSDGARPVQRRLHQRIPRGAVTGVTGVQTYRMMATWGKTFQDCHWKPACLPLLHNRFLFWLIVWWSFLHCL